MELLKGLPWRRAFLAVVLNLLALSLSTTALLSSYWCTGTQKVAKPLCGNNKGTKCIGVPVPLDAGASNVSSEDVVHYSWETGDDRFAFRYFHTGMWLSCEESMEGPGSVLPSQTQLLPLCLLHRSLEMKGWRLTTLEAAFIIWNGISPMHCGGHYISVLHWDVFRGRQGKMIVSGVPFKSRIRTVKCKWWCQWLCDGIVYPDMNWGESPFSFPISPF